MLTAQEIHNVEQRYQITLPTPTTHVKQLVEKISLHSNHVPDSLQIPCVRRHTGTNTIDHWRQFCPIPHIAFKMLKIDTHVQWNLTQSPTNLQGTTLTYLLFHMRQVLQEEGTLSKDHSDLALTNGLHTPIEELARKSYQSMPYVFAHQLCKTR